MLVVVLRHWRRFATHNIGGDKQCRYGCRGDDHLEEAAMGAINEMIDATPLRAPSSTRLAMRLHHALPKESLYLLLLWQKGDCNALQGHCSWSKNCNTLQNGYM